MPQQRACVSRRRDLLRQARYQTGTEDADQTDCGTQSQYADTGSTSPSGDPVMPDWQGSQSSTNHLVTGMT